jgi:hypothetical protein
MKTVDPVRRGFPDDPGGSVSSCLCEVFRGLGSSRNPNAAMKIDTRPANLK